MADEIIRQDKSLAAYRTHNGSILVRLNKALYGCIESTKLWYEEIAGTLRSTGFTANPRDLCVFNKSIKENQFTIDLKMTCIDKDAPRRGTNLAKSLRSIQDNAGFHRIIPRPDLGLQ